MADDTVTARIVFDTGGVAAAARGAAGRAGGGGGRLGGIGQLAGGIGKIATGVFAGLAAFEGMKALMGKLVAASPQLQATLTVLRKSLEFILRPIGDAIGLAIRPFALLMLRFAIKFYKDALPRMEEWFSGLGDLFTDGFEGFKGLFEGGVGEFIKNLFVDVLPAQFVQTWEQLKSTLGTIWELIKVLFVPVWENLKLVLGPLLALIGFNMVNVLKGLEIGLLAIQIVIEAALPILEFATGAWVNFLTVIKEWVIFLVGSAITGVRKFISRTKFFFEETLPAAFETAKTRVSEILTGIKDAIVGAFETVRDKIRAVVDAIVEKIASLPLIGGAFNTNPAQTDFIMRGNTVTPISPQDNIVGFQGNAPPAMGGGGGGGMSLTIQINALDPSAIDDSVIRRISDAIDDMQKRGIMSRTMQGTGA